MYTRAYLKAKLDKGGVEDIIDIIIGLQNDIAAVDTAVDAMATKLNADAGVTDTNYAGPALTTQGL